MNTTIPLTVGKHPCLYKQTNTGKVQSWLVSVEGAKVTTTFGLVGGKQQVVVDIVKAGKNIGRANATTPESQAAAQANQEFQGKLKEGYVSSLETATKTKNTLGAVEPMLAFPIEKKPKHVVFPGLAQPKLDGLRCIAIIADGEVRLFSRKQKPILTVPHIVDELEGIYQGKTVTLDGELYNHDLKDDFNEITSLAKRDDVHEDSKRIQFHVYDVVAPGGYRERAGEMLFGLADYCFEVRTVTVHSMAELEAFQAECIAQGYEGAMYRNPDGAYEHKRSPNLLKVKTFQDAEFEIIGAEEGTGKLMGAVGAFLLRTKKGDEFGAKPMGTLAQSQAYWRARAKLVGKLATIKFQNYTPDGIPRFPVFKCVRED